MSADQAQREPTMEEILASIRRIISEEDKGPEEAADVLNLQPAPAPVTEVKPAAAPAPKPEPKPEPVVAKAPPPPAPEPEIFDEIDVLPERPLEDELMIMEQEAAPEPAPQSVAAAPVVEARPDFRAQPVDTIVGEPAAARAAGSLGKLMGSMLMNSGNTLDDVVRELMKPMLKEWLDAHLPAIVEAEVEREIERIRRLAR